MTYSVVLRGVTKETAKDRKQKRQDSEMMTEISRFFVQLAIFFFHLFWKVL